MNLKIDNVRQLSLFFGVILCAFMMIHTALWWPGSLTPDSMTQYIMAKQGIYSDHHPAVMSWVWRYLDKVIEGPALMLILHFTLLYAGMWLFMDTISSALFKKNRLLTWSLCSVFVLIPFFPGIFIYSGMIWKDIGFAFAYVLCAGLLTRAWMQQRGLRVYEHMLFFLVLFYGTSIKFQGQYLAPVMLLWWSMLVWTHHKVNYVILRFAISLFFFYTALVGVNRILVPTQQENHSWQYVKLYDLAALSVYKDTPLFPEFAQTQHFTQSKLHSTFNHRLVDDLAFPQDAILRIGKTVNEREELWHTWMREVLHAPHIYLMHRVKNLAYTLLGVPGFETFMNLLNARYDPHSLTYKILKYTARSFGYIVFAHALFAVLTIIYMMGGAFSLRRSRWAAPLFFMNLSSTVLIGALLFFSMAGTPRYTYIMMCLCQISHVFAFLTWRERRTDL